MRERIRAFLGVVLYVIAGVFFYTATLFGFMAGQPVGTKWGILVINLLLACLVLGAGLALRRFETWNKDVGFVLLSATASSAFVVFTFLCFFLTDEFGALLKPDVLQFFSDYHSGVGFGVGLAAIGVLLLRLKAN